MKTQDSLFLLIQSLTKSQKRYFKMSVSLYSGDKVYLKLFDAIDKQKEYDEKAIRKKFHGENFIKQLSRTKHYLYQLILKSIRSSASQESVTGQLRGMLSDIEYLYGNGFYEQCQKIIVKSKALASKHEQFGYMAEIARWGIAIISSRYFHGKTEEEMEGFYRELLGNIDKYKQVTENQVLTYRMFIKIEKEGFPRNTDELNKFQSIINHPLFQRKEDVLTLSELIDKYLCRMAYHYGNDEYHKAELDAQKLIDAMDVRPHLLSENIPLYVNILGNLISCQVSLKKYEELFLNIKKMKEIKTASKKTRSKIFYTANIQGLFAFIQSGEFNEGIKWVQNINDALSMKEVFCSEEETGVLYFNIACIYFGAGNYSDANFWLNKILNETTIDLRVDVQCFTQILHLIVHFEKDKEDLVGYRVLSAERFLKSRKRLYQFEKVILDFFRKELPKMNTNQKRTNGFKTLKTEIEKVVTDTFEQKALRYFDIISWLESKIKKRTFAEVVREKVVKGL